MATYERNGLLTYKDGAGNKYLLYPITKKDCVDGIDELEAQLAEKAPMLAYKMTAPFAVSNPNQSPMLVNTSGDFSSAAMQRSYIACEDASQNPDLPVPSGPFYAAREVDAVPAGQGYYTKVTLHELYPTAGRVWTTVFDGSSWSPWSDSYPHPYAAMELGVEYLTAERYAGKAVCAKLVDCGAITNGKIVSWGVPNGLTAILECRLNGNDWAEGFFDAFDGAYSVHSACNTNGIYIYCGSAMEGRQAYARIKYVKA